MQKQCKFGPRCNKFAMGQCTFLHADQSQTGGNQNFSTGGNFGNNPRGPRPNFGQQGYGGGNDGGRGNYSQGNRPNYNQGNQSNFKQGGYGQGGQGGYSQKNPVNYQQGQSGFGQGNKGGWGTQHGNYGKDQGNQHTPNIPKQDQFQRGFCRDFQYNQICKFSQTGKCTRIHGFDTEQKIHRVNYTNQIPLHEKSKIGKFQKDGQTYFILRMGNQIKILTLNQTKDDFVERNKWSFPSKQLNYDYYSQNENFIYLAAQNPKTFIYNIWIYDALTGNLIVLEQAHERVVTGVIHFNNQIVLSCAKDGKINVWKIQGNKGIIDKATSDHIQKTYVLENVKIQLNFLNITKMGEIPIVTAGTNDGRVLFFYGDQLNFNFINLGQNYAKVFDIKYTTVGGIYVGFVLTWSHDNSASSIIAIDINNLAPSVILNFNAKQIKNNNINLIQIVDDNLFVANLFGNITVYSLPKVQKVGLIMNRNRVNSILPASYLTQTQIKRNLILILQNKFGQKPGSLAIYLMKQ